MGTYSEKDGVPTFEIDQFGKVWFGSTNGVTAYHPKNDQKTVSHPRLRLLK
jgi:hypothetical protein